MQKETLILASNNAGKLREMREILDPFGLEVRSQKEAGFTGNRHNLSGKRHHKGKGCAGSFALCRAGG